MANFTSIIFCQNRRKIKLFFATKCKIFVRGRRRFHASRALQQPFNADFWLRTWGGGHYVLFIISNVRYSKNSENGMLQK